MPRAWPGRSWPSSWSGAGAVPRWSPMARSPRQRSCSPVTGWGTSRRLSGPSRSPPRHRPRPDRAERRSASRSRYARCSALPTLKCKAAVRTEDLLRELAPQALGALVRRYGDFAGSEDAVQEALLAAAAAWPAAGQPDNPLVCVIRIASRRLANQYRGEVARRRREELAA